MKPRTAIALLALSLTSISTLAYAHYGNEGGNFAEQKTNRLKQELSLSDDQATKVQDIFKNYQPKQEEMNTMKDRWDKMHTDISSVLTPEQKTKYDQLQIEKQGRWNHKQHGRHHGKRQSQN